MAFKSQHIAQTTIEPALNPDVDSSSPEVLKSRYGCPMPEKERYIHREKYGNTPTNCQLMREVTFNFCIES